MLSTMRVIFVVLFLLSFEMTANAQMSRQLKSVFDGFVPPNQQYAVVAFNINEVRYIWPEPVVGQQKPLWSNNSPSTWLLKYGSGGDHSELGIFTNASQIEAGFQEIWGKEITNISLYTYLGPCLQCAQAINDAVIHNNWRSDISFTSQWSGQSDSDAYLAMKLLAAFSNVHRQCEQGPCETFQEALKQCMAENPIICQYCTNRNDGIVTFINEMMEQSKSRNPLIWGEFLPRVIGNAPERQLIIGGVQSCVTSTRDIPIGPPLRPFTGFLPVVIPFGPPGPNWQAVTNPHSN